MTNIFDKNIFVSYVDIMPWKCPIFIPNFHNFQQNKMVLQKA